jgi:act minimal PKS chain-length factor (CLF/KS beta)
VVPVPARSRTAVTAVSARTALGDLDATFAALLGGRSAAAPLGGALGRRFPGAHAALVREPGAAARAPAPEADLLRGHGALLAACARAAHEEGGASAIERERVALFVAFGMVDSGVEDLGPAVLASRGEDGSLDLRRFFATGFRSIHPLWPLSMLANVAAGLVSIELDLRGEGIVLACDADATVHALGAARDAMAAGTAAGALVAGVGEMVRAESLMRLELEGRLARGPAHPFDPEGRGASPGEGGACLLLEEAAAAEARGRRPLGFLAGVGTAHGAATGGGPDAGALERAARAALEEAGLGPGGVDAVFAAADGNVADAEEAEALRRVFGGDPPPILATRGPLGQLKAGGPAVDVGLALRALAEGRFPPAAAGAPRGRSFRSGAPDRVLVLARGGLGSAGAILVEGPRCAS